MNQKENKVYFLSLFQRSLMAEYWELMESKLGWEPRELFPLKHDFGQIPSTCKMRGLDYVLSSSQILTLMMPFSNGFNIYSFTEYLLHASHST